MPEILVKKYSIEMNQKLNTIHSGYTLLDRMFYATLEEITHWYDDSELYPDSLRFDNDYSSFEIACYLTYRIEHWLDDESCPDEIKEKIINHLGKNLITVYSEIGGIDSAREILKDREILYSNIFKDKSVYPILKSHKKLSQLIGFATENKRLPLHSEIEVLPNNISFEVNTIVTDNVVLFDKYIIEGVKQMILNVLLYLGNNSKAG